LWNYLNYRLFNDNRKKQEENKKKRSDKYFLNKCKETYIADVVVLLSMSRVLASID